MKPQPDSLPASVWVLVDPFDHHVVGVYDSKDKAKSAGDAYKRSEVVESEDEMRVEEHRLNREF